MTRTEELLFRASTCDRVALTADECKQIVGLVLLQNAALKFAADKVYSEQNDDEIGVAIAAFNKFEGGE